MFNNQTLSDVVGLYIVTCLCATLISFASAPTPAEGIAVVQSSVENTEAVAAKENNSLTDQDGTRTLHERSGGT